MVRKSQRHDLLIGEIEKSLDGSLPRIRSIGSMMFDPVWAESMHKASGAEILHVIRGSVELRFKGSSYHAGAGDTLIVPPDELHRDEFKLEEGLEVFYVSFNWPAGRAFWELANNKVLRSMSEPAKNGLRLLFDQLRADLSGGGGADRLVARSRVQMILLLMFREACALEAPREASAGRAAGRTVLMQKAKLWVEKHYAECILLDDVADALGVSPYYLSHVFSEESDFTLFSYLTNLRMEKARALLREGRLSVADVARAVGWQDANYFAKVFRKKTGCSPRSFGAKMSMNRE